MEEERVCSCFSILSFIIYLSSLLVRVFVFVPADPPLSSLLSLSRFLSLSLKTNLSHLINQIALTDPLVLRGMLALRTANVAVLGGRVPRLEGAKERARAAWSKPPDGRTRWAAAAVAGGQENIRAGQGAGPTLYEKARAAAWPGAALVASAAHAAAAAVAPPLAPPSGPPRQPQQQEQQQNRAPLATVIFLDSSDDDEDVKMEAAGGGGGRGGADGSTEAEQRRRLPSFFPLPAAAGPAPASWPRRSLSEAAAAAAAAATGSSPPPPSQYSTRCLVRGSVVQAITALRFMDAGTGEALEGFGLAVELEESPVSGGDSGRSGTGSREEEEGFTALARCPAALSHAVVSGLLGGISTRDLVDQYAREGREAVMGKVSRVKAFFDGFDGWLGVEAAATETRRRKREEEEGSGGGAAAAAAAATTAPSLVVVGWWEA